MSIVFGYARVSMSSKSLDAQRDALLAAGVDLRHLRVEAASGRRDYRPVPAGLLDELAPGDEVVVAKLDRLGRSVPHLVHVVDDRDHRGVRLRSLSEAIDTTSPGGRFMVRVLDALAQMETDLIRECPLDGPRRGPNPRGRLTVMISGAHQRSPGPRSARGRQPAAAVARALGVSVSTIRRHITAPAHDAPTA